MKTIIRTHWTDGKGNLLFWSEQENLNPGPVKCFTPDGVELKGTPAENLLKHHVTGKIERGEGAAIVGNPALPVTDNQLRQFYLDWTNNFCSTKGCADHYGITQDEARAFIEAGRKLHNLEHDYHVAAVSSNTNSFGYKSVLAVNAAGLGVQLLVQAYGTDKVPEVGDVVTLGESRFYGAPSKLPSVTPEKAAKIIKTLTK